MIASVNSAVEVMTTMNPAFVTRRMGTAEARSLFRQAGVELSLLPMPAYAMALPQIRGARRVLLSDRLPSTARAFVALHELVHVAEGHGTEIEILRLGAVPYPLEDQVADAVAAIGITSSADRETGPSDLADLLRTLVPVEAVAWRVFRSTATAELLHGWSRAHERADGESFA